MLTDIPVPNFLVCSVVIDFHEQYNYIDAGMNYKLYQSLTLWANSFCWHTTQCHRYFVDTPDPIIVYPHNSSPCMSWQIATSLHACIILWTATGCPSYLYYCNLSLSRNEIIVGRMKCNPKNFSVYCRTAFTRIGVDNSQVCFRSRSMNIWLVTLGYKY